MVVLDQLDWQLFCLVNTIHSFVDHKVSVVDIEKSMYWIGFIIRCAFHRLLINPYCDNRQQSFQATAAVNCCNRDFNYFLV